MKLPGDYIAGFIDGEGCFSITIGKHRTTKNRLDPRLVFEIELRDDDKNILCDICETLKCGRIYHLSYKRYGWAPHVKLKVSSLKDIKERLIPFLYKYPLRAKKRRSFDLFCKAVEIFERKEHLTECGIKQLYDLRKQMNKYLSA